MFMTEAQLGDVAELCVADKARRKECGNFTSAEYAMHMKLRQ